MPRSGMYRKKEIDSLIEMCYLNTCEVSLIRLTAEDIANYKLRFIKKTDDATKEDGNIPKVNDTLKDSKTSQSNKSSKDDKNSNDVKTSKDDETSKNNTSIHDEPTKKQQNMDNNEIDVLKLVVSREGETQKCKSQFKSILQLNKGIASTSTEGVLVEIDCKESMKSVNSSTTNLKPRIWIKELKEIMDPDKHIRWLKTFDLDKTPNHLPNCTNKSAVVKLSEGSNKVNGDKQFEIEHLIKIAKLYKKNFNKSIQSCIFTIANMIKIINISNTHLLSQIDESSKKISDAEKVKYICDASLLHIRHTKILETKLKINFNDVVSFFEESEFDLAFQMFILSILNVLRVVEQPNFKTSQAWKNLVILLQKTLKNTEYNHPRVFSLLWSKTFQDDCFDLISLIEYSRNINPEVTDQLSLFFVSTVNSREYFQAVIDVVTSDSQEDLSLLIDNASNKCLVNLTFKDPIDSSTAQRLNVEIPVTAMSLNPIHISDTIQQVFVTKNPDGTYRQLPVILIKPNLHPPLSSLLQKKTPENSTSEVIPTSKCLVVASTISVSPLVQVPTTATTSGTMQPSNQNKRTVANSPLRKAGGGTGSNGDTQFQYVPPCKLKKVMNSSNTSVKPEPTSTVKCNNKNCNKPSKITCSECRVVKYCSKICQNSDWFDRHQHTCEQMKNLSCVEPRYSGIGGMFGAAMLLTGICSGILFGMITPFIVEHLSM